MCPRQQCSTTQLFNSCCQYNRRLKREDHGDGSAGHWLHELQLTPYMSLTIQLPYVQDNYFFKLNKYAPVVAIIEGNSTRALTIVTILLVYQLESLY